MTIEHMQSAYKEFVSAIELTGITLLELSVKRPPTDEIEGTLRYDLSPKFELISIAEPTIKVAASFKLIGDREEGKKQRKILTMDAKFQLSYKLVKKLEVIDEEIVQRFVKANVPVNAWPYFRELISTTTAKIDYPSLVIGTLKTVR